MKSADPWKPRILSFCVKKFGDYVSRHETFTLFQTPYFIDKQEEREYKMKNYAFASFGGEGEKPDDKTCT